MKQLAKCLDLDCHGRIDFKDFCCGVLTMKGQIEREYGTLILCVRRVCMFINAFSGCVCLYMCVYNMPPLLAGYIRNESTGKNQVAVYQLTFGNDLVFLFKLSTVTRKIFIFATLSRTFSILASFFIMY